MASVIPNMNNKTCTSARHSDEGETQKIESESQRLHRYVSVERLGAYSDAVFSIIITFMIIPLSTAVEDFDIDKNIKDSLLEEWHRFLIYGLCYFIVFAIWETHVRAYDVVEHVGDTVIILNVIQLLAASLLPFLAALLGDFSEDPLATCLLSCDLVAIALLQILTVIFAYRRKKMLVEDLHKRDLLVELCSSAGVLLCFGTISAGVAFANRYVAWALLGSAVFFDTFSIILVAIYRGAWANPDDKHTNMRQYVTHRLMTRRSNPSRTKNFTDGVFAIVATLIILDLTNAAANPSESGPGSIIAELEEDKETFFSYFSTFFTVGMIWYIHYTLFHPIQQISQLTSLCNKWVLLFVGVLPMGFKLISKFSTDTWDMNENIAVQFNCFIIFFTSVFQFLTWLSGHWKRHKHLHPGYGRIHVYWCCILCLIYPTISLIMALVAFIPSSIDARTVQSIQIAVPVLIFFIKFCFEIYVHRPQQNGRTYGETEDIRASSSSSDIDEANAVSVSVDTNL